MTQSILKRHTEDLGEARDDENLRASLLKMKDTQDFLMIMAGFDPEEAEEAGEPEEEETNNE